MAVPWDEQVGVIEKEEEEDGAPELENKEPATQNEKENEETPIIQKEEKEEEEEQGGEEGGEDSEEEGDDVIYDIPSTDLASVGDPFKDFPTPPRFSQEEEKKEQDQRLWAALEEEQRAKEEKEKEKKRKEEEEMRRTAIRARAITAQMQRPLRKESVKMEEGEPMFPPPPKNTPVKPPSPSTPQPELHTAWGWTIDLERYPRQSSERVFYDRAIGEFDNAARMFEGIQPKPHCVYTFLHIIDRILLLFDSICDPADVEAQNTLLRLVRKIPVRLFSIAECATQRPYDNSVGNTRERKIVREIQAGPDGDDFARVYTQYLHFLHLVSDEEEARVLRGAFTEKDSVHSAYILPVLTLCNLAAARADNAVFAATSMAMIANVVCCIVDMRRSDLPVDQIPRKVNESCWDLFDSITRGDLSRRTKDILSEIALSRPQSKPKAAAEPPASLAASSSETLKPLEKESSFCNIQ